MRQIAQYQDGRLELQEVPKPTAPHGGVLVRTTHSVISVGTEKMKVEQARMNLLQKARARPDQVRKILDTAKTLGWRSALEKVRNRLQPMRGALCDWTVPAVRPYGLITPQFAQLPGWSCFLSSCGERFR